MANLPEDCLDYPMEPENRQIIHALLPEHVRDVGPIVEIVEIFEMHSVEDALELRKIRSLRNLRQG